MIILLGLTIILKTFLMPTQKICRNIILKLISRKGPSHKPIFETAAILNGVFLSLGSGYRKIDAEMRAAELAYNKIIENQDIDFGVRAKFKSRLKFILNDLQNSFIGKKPKR